MKIQEIVFNKIRSHTSNPSEIGQAMLLGATQAIIERVFLTLETLDLQSALEQVTDPIDTLCNGDWETCEACSKILPADGMKHDVEGVPLCEDCYAEEAEMTKGMTQGEKEDA